jgi:hypothetical protein
VTILIIGLVMFVAGSVLNWVGWELDKRSRMTLPPGFLDWLLDEIKHWFGKLTGRDSSTGERLAAFGAILAAFGLVIMAVGVGVLAAE